MNQQQEPLKIGDLVEIVTDHRFWLIGRRGRITFIADNQAHITFTENIGRGKAAVCFLSNIKKVEEN
jgi:hypothetical protein